MHKESNQINLHFLIDAISVKWHAWCFFKKSVHEEKKAHDVSVTHPTVGFTNILWLIHWLEGIKTVVRFMNIVHYIIKDASLLNTSVWVCKPGWLTSVAHWVIVCPTAAVSQWENPDKSFSVLQREDGAREQKREWCQDHFYHICTQLTECLCVVL